MRSEQDIDAAKKSGFAEGPGKHGGDHFGGVGNLESCQGIGGAVEDAHFRRALAQAKSQVGAWHAARTKRGNEEIDGAGAGIGELERLLGVGRGQDKKIGVFEDLLHGIAQGFRVFDDEDDRMRRCLCLHSSHNNLNSTEGLRSRTESGQVYYETVNNQAKLHGGNEIKRGEPG